MVLRKALAAALVILPLGAASVATERLYREPAEVVVDFERGYEGGFISGFHARELDGGVGFRWTDGDGFVKVRQLPVGANLEVDVKIKALPAPGQGFPVVRFTVNGAPALQATAARGFTRYHISVPDSPRTLTLGIHSPAFTLRDGRSVGVQLYSVRLAPQSAGRRSTRPVALLAITAAIFLAAGKSAGLSLPISSIAATLLSLGFAYLLGQKSVRFTGYPEEVLELALGTVLAALLLRILFRLWGWPRPAERSALSSVLTWGLLFKVAAFTYPLFLSSDATFQANRLADVLAGHFFPTSVTQHVPPFRIPYPISLYVFAAPWALLGLDPVRVLEWLTALADAGVGLALSYLAWRFLGSVRAGVLAAALYPLVPVQLLAFSAGNFTNLFGVAATTLFLTAFLSLWQGGHRARWTAATFLSSVVALTSHVSIFLSGIVLWPVWVATVLGLVPPGPASPSRRWVAATVLLSAAAALGYYAGYFDLIRSQLPRLTAREYSTGSMEVAGPVAKLTFNLPFYREWLGSVFALVALGGAVTMLRRVGQSALKVAAAGWLAVTVLFFLLDLFTSVEVRYLLQATPLLALFAGVYLSGALDRGRLGRLAAWAVVAYLGVLGLLNYRECLLERYH